MATYSFERREYLEDVIESQGFFVTNDYGRKIPCGIVKIGENSEAFEKAKKTAIFAVDKQNEKLKNSSKLELLKIININFEPTAGAIYYITLAAMDFSCGKILHYQAKVLEKINTGYKVETFQLAPYVPKFSEYEEEKNCCIRINNLQDWMDENYLYYKCCYIFKKLVYVEVIKDEENGKSMGYGFLNFKNHSVAMEFAERNKGKPMPNSNQIYSLVFGEN
ncbi:hypothetical protein K7X08_022294 [Anisodus acutangulus]|uniref:RRM domain-containing protein n=1 Tax=Anisodus acutangulus TaxID=402998 RepID=A0A9Q1MIS5_9SOLA|nr:hypothetical protein K7X08_022294 [Anisodus acutangulus]